MENNQLIKRKLTFEFKGDGFEYFKIWIVNILLTIVTLGIYSAWAKVRNNRYFYSNTYLDNDHFQYLADPITILKGRIVAIIALVIYWFIANTYPIAGMAIAFIFVLAIPYFVNQSMAFNHRMSAYKNIQFRFKATYAEAFKVIYVWPILGFLTLGILYPQAVRKMHHYKACNSSFGTTAFEFETTYKDYAIKFLIALGIALVLGVPSWLIATYMPSIGFISPIIMVVMYVAMVLYLMVSISNLFFSRLIISDHYFESSLSMSGLGLVMLKNLILTILTLGLYLPAAKVRMAKYLTAHIVLNVTGSLDTFISAEKQTIDAMGEEFGEVFDFGI